MKTLELTPRLKKVAELVPKGAKLADVGTDHAYLPAWLLLNGRISHAIAADINKGPLDRAKKTAEQFQLGERMEFRLCNGLSAISPDEVDTVVIAGMGGETIAQILAAAPWVKDGGHALILQPMSSQEDLRLWLYTNGFSICSECIVREGKTLYTIMYVNASRAELPSKAELLAGKPQPGEGEWGAYAREQRQKLNYRIEGLRRSASSEKNAECLQLEEISLALDELIKEWEEWQR